MDGLFIPWQIRTERCRCAVHLTESLSLQREHSELSRLFIPFSASYVKYNIISPRVKTRKLYDFVAPPKGIFITWRLVPFQYQEMLGPSENATGKRSLLRLGPWTTLFSSHYIIQGGPEKLHYFHHIILYRVAQKKRERHTSRNMCMQ